MHGCARSLFARLVIAASLFPVALSASVLWYGDKSGLHQIDTATNAIAVDVAFEPPVAIAVNAADGSVSVLTQSRLARLDARGALQFQLSLNSSAPRLLALNPNDGSVWAGFENQLLHVNGSGAVTLTLSIAADDLAVAQDGSLWLLSGQSLQHLDSAGHAISTVPAVQKSKFIAVDDTGGTVWLGGEKSLIAVTTADPSRIALSLTAPETISAIAADVQTGQLWVLGQQSLFAFRRDGSPALARDLRDFGIANAQALAFDFASQAVWVGHQQGLSRISTGGLLVATFPADAKTIAVAIGRAPVEITPVVTILAPADGALINNPTPTLRVKYDALCGSSSCGFPNSFFSSFSLTATLDGAAVGSSFVFDPATGTASYTPPSRLAEGLNTFSAQARDAFGHNSAVVSSSFTLDTIAPSFQNVAPPSGTVFTNTSSVTITGSVDDPAATVRLGAQSQGATFSFTLTLVEGPNSYTLEARDRAGNLSTFPLTYTFSPPVNAPPTVTITRPLTQSSYSAPASVHVYANAADSDGNVVKVDFLLDGVIRATVMAPGKFDAILASIPSGNHTLTARATDNLNATATSPPVPISVVAPSISITSPAPNAQISGDSVLVTGHIISIANGGVAVNNSVAPLDSANNFWSVVSLTPGVNTITATLTAGDGSTATQTVNVTATGTAPPYSVVPDKSSGLAPLFVVFSVANLGSLNATFTFNGFGPFNLPAGTILRLSTTFQAGVSVNTVVFTDTAGARTTQQVVVEARDPAQMDQMFLAIWNGMNNALVAGDRDGAMVYLNFGAQRKFGPVFDVLMPFMPQIVASYSPLVRSSLSSSIGEYGVVRVFNGQKRLYLIYFLRDADGVWRIDEM
jgi:Big-like domain-containing protein/glucodextranase-like protein